MIKYLKMKVLHFCLWQGEALEHDVSAGVILSNMTLVLQRLTREDRGEYVCAARNSRGEGRSNAVPLVIKCESFYPGHLSGHFFLDTVYLQELIT